jgi:hypothetical protein
MEKAYDAVKDVTKKKELWRLGVVVDDLWITYKGGSEEHIELLLRDVKVIFCRTSDFSTNRKWI